MYHLQRQIHLLLHAERTKKSQEGVYHNFKCYCTSYKQEPFYGLQPHRSVQKEAVYVQPSDATSMIASVGH